MRTAAILAITLGTESHPLVEEIWSTLESVATTSSNDVNTRAEVRQFLGKKHEIVNIE